MWGLMAKRSNKKPATIPKGQSREEGVLSTECVLPEWKLVLIHAAIIIGAGVWIYWPALQGAWIWDDSLYFYQNPLLNEPNRLWKAWFQPGSFIEYYPIEETIQWLQWQLWGNNTLGYHLTNLGLHLTGAFVVWRLLSKFGLRLAWVGGLIFAVHPMMVESVAWISEFKNTLSLPPFLLAACAYIDYVERGRRADYLRALALFLVAMLCKIGVAPFPVIIFLYVWWKRRRIGWNDCLATIPFFVISLILGWVTAWCGNEYLQHQLKVPATVDVGGFLSRIALAGQTLSFYFTKCFWPLGPLPIYPQWKIDPASPMEYLPWFALAATFYWLWQRRQGWGRNVLLGLGFFILMLAPFLGFIPVSYMSFTWVMDHFLYVPIIGLIGIVVAGLENLDSRLSPALHPLRTGILTVLISLLVFESHWYAAAFTGDETFWTYTIDRNPDAWLAHNNLGKILLDVGEPDQARQHFETVIRLQPRLGEPYCNLGTALAKLVRMPEAFAAFRQSLKLDPYSPEANNDVGILLAQTGHMDDAIAHFDLALKGHPHYTDAHVNLGNAFLLTGRTSEAIQQFQAAVEIDPSSLSAHDDLALALSQAGRYTEAVDHFRRALQLDPNDDKATQGLARLQQEQQKTPSAQ